MTWYWWYVCTFTACQVIATFVHRCPGLRDAVIRRSGMMTMLVRIMIGLVARDTGQDRWLGLDKTSPGHMSEPWVMECVASGGTEGKSIYKAAELLTGGGLHSNDIVGDVDFDIQGVGVRFRINLETPQQRHIVQIRKYILKILEGVCTDV